MDYRKLFEAVNPGFFERDYIKKIPEKLVYDEMIMELSSFDEKDHDINAPGGITFDYYKGDFDTFLEAVRSVDDSWADIYKPMDRIFCAFDGERIASFCMIEDMNPYSESGISYKIGGPGCVGTVPEYRKRGIGLVMINKATQILKDLGYDISYVHYTGVAHWYAALGYKTVLSWRSTGVIHVEEG
ncbi:MAG: GNAT family N-acetyltransferase [Butyrivibrio sp.]|nr:GNAT family N-acetyltransferase [Butyrivibrio sp.]